MNWTIYLKTTETCNLNCKHCFTSGRNGQRVFFDPKKVIPWMKEFLGQRPTSDSVHVEFHGGEPFLADVSDMNDCYEACKADHPNMSWGATSNLTFKLTDEIVSFIHGPLGKRIGTSWDPDIRFDNAKQQALWSNNVLKLISQGVTVKVNISVTTGLIKMDPHHLLAWIKDLGVNEISFERLTKNGNALEHPEIFPTNKQQDQWFMKFHEVSEKMKTREWLYEEFLESVYTKFETNNTKSATFCRNCEQKIFTLNATGTISGCPNSATTEIYGTLDDTYEQLMASPARLNAISCEAAGNIECLSCNVYQYCGGDCHQLAWENGICGAPKTLMQHLAGVGKDDIPRQPPKSNDLYSDVMIIKMV